MYKSLTLLFFLGIFGFSSPLRAEDESTYDTTIDLSLVEQASHISTGGSGGKPYYSLDIQGVHFEGERNWSLRWNLFKDILNFENKKILELGCNTALSSTYLLKYRQALACTGVDLPDDQLTFKGIPRLMEAANLLHHAFRVKVKMLQLNLDEDEYERTLGYDYDVVICMSLLNWVHDKERLLDYLSKFTHVIFEGHEADEIEIARFQQIGFSNYRILGKTQIGKSYPANATRTLIYFHKD